MFYIHDLNICNLNINADNIYINENLDIKIFDFKNGYYYVDKERKSIYYGGNQSYTSPEIRSKNPYYPETADVWACGVFLYYLLTGNPPFQGKTSILLDKAIMKGEYQMSNIISNEMNDLLRKIFSRKQSDRYKFKDIINSEYIIKNNYSEFFIHTKGLNIIEYYYNYYK